MLRTARQVVDHVAVRVEAELLDVLPAKKRGELVALLGHLATNGAKVEA